MNKIHTLYILLSMLFFFSVSPAQATEITNYVNGQTLDSTSVTFDLLRDPGSTNVFFGVRTDPTTLYADICEEAIYDMEQTNFDLGVLPDNGMDIYITIQTVLGDSTSTFKYYNFRTPIRFDLPTGAAMTAPAAESTLDSTTVTFEWQDIGASQYWLDIGTAPGKKDILSGQAGYSDQPDFSASATILELPESGIPLYVRLWSKIDDDWVFTDTTYTAYTDPEYWTPVEMISPVPLSVLDSTTVTFEWKAIDGAEAYVFLAGTSYGGTEIANSGSLPVTTTSYTVEGLVDDGHTVWIRLWTRVGGRWSSEYYKYFGYTAPL